MCPFKPAMSLVETIPKFVEHSSSQNTLVWSCQCDFQPCDNSSLIRSHQIISSQIGLYVPLSSLRIQIRMWTYKHRQNGASTILLRRTLLRLESASPFQLPKLSSNLYDLVFDQFGRLEARFLRILPGMSVSHGHLLTILLVLWLINNISLIPR
jgi:hypothetical protein